MRYLVGVVCGIAVLLQGAARAEVPSKFQEKAYTSSKVCAECHAEIYSKWRNSLHGMALEDPIFQSAYARVVTSLGHGAGRTCIRCHAPAVQQNKDWDLLQEVTREGVSCDFCHTVSGVRLDNPLEPYVIAIGAVKRGPLPDARPSAHGAQNSELHRSSEFCAGCHEWRTPEGLLLMGTYTEWKNGPYAGEGVQCQDCHMPLTQDPVVRAEVRPIERRANLHDLGGAHSSEQVRKAAKVTIVSSRRSAGRILVKVGVTNTGSGHMIPTGIPTREVVLEVSLVNEHGRVLSQEREVFRRSFADSAGRILTDDAEVLTRAARLVSDNRIQPRETREVEFSLPAPAGGRATAEARLFYRYAPLIAAPREIIVEMATRRAAVD